MMMKDYRKYRGFDVAVMTPEGSFHGQLREVGDHTLTLKVKKWYAPDGQPADGGMDGLLVLDRLSIRLMQVK